MVGAEDCWTHATIISKYHQVKMEVTSKPAELERLDRKILQHLNCNLGPLSLVVFLVFHRFSISGEMLLKSVHVRLEMERLSVGEDKEGFLKFAESIQKTPQPSANECGRNTHWTGQPVIGKDGRHQWRIGQARLCCNTQLYSDLHWGAMCSSAAFVVKLWSWLAPKLAFGIFQASRAARRTRREMAKRAWLTSTIFHFWTKTSNLSTLFWQLHTHWKT